MRDLWGNHLVTESADGERAGILRGLVSVFFGHLGEFLFGIAITPILVRVLTDSQYGDYAFIISLSGVLIVAVEAGIFDGLRKYIAERADQRWRTLVFVFYARLAGILALIVLLLSGLVWWFDIADAYLGTTLGDYALLLGAYVVGEQAFQFVRGTLMGYGMESRSEPLVVLRRLGFGVVGVGLALFGYGVSGVLIGEIVGAVIAVGVGFWYVRRQVDMRAVTESLPNDFPRRKLASFNYKTILLSLLMVSLYHVDVIMIRLFFDGATTAYYKGALVVAEFLWFAPVVMQLVFLQSASSMWGRDDRSSITNLASLATRYVTLLTLLLALGIAALAEPFLSLYFGPGFTVAASALLLLLPGALGFAIARPIVTIEQAKGDMRPVVLATAVAAVANLILNVALIPRYGIEGAAVATSIGYGLMAVVHVVTARSMGFDPIGDLRIGPVGLTTLGASIAIFGLESIIHSDIVAMIVVPPVGFGVFVALAFVSGAIDREELSYVTALR